MKLYKQVRLVKRGPIRDYVTLTCFLSTEDIAKGTGNVFTLKDATDDRRWAIEKIYEELTMTEETLQMKRAGWKSINETLK